MAVYVSCVGSGVHKTDGRLRVIRGDSTISKYSQVDAGVTNDDETAAAEVTAPLLPHAVVSSPASSPSQGEDDFDDSVERDVDSRDTHEESSNNKMAPPKHPKVHRLSHPNRNLASHNETNHRAVSFAPDVKELVASINRDNYAGVVSLLELDPDMANSLDEAGRRPLVLAVAKQSIPLCEMLIRSGADVNAPDKDGYTAVMEACRVGNIDIVRQMLKNGGKVHARDHGGWTPLMWACYKNHVSVVKLLLEYGANPNMKDENSMSSLIWAAGRGHAEVVKLLCDANAKVDATDKFGNTALLWACRKRHSGVASILIDAGAKVDVAGMNSWTPLLAAINNNDVEVAKQILKYGPNVNTIDKDGKTPIMIAAKQGCTEIALRLLECGAYVNVRDKEGDTVLMIATKAGHPEIVQALLARHADADAVNPRNGKTALFYAVEKNHIQVVDLLLRAKVSTELRSKDGDTPLFHAVRNRFGAVTQLLLHYNADIAVVDKLGDTPLHVAVRSRNKKITDLLLRKPRYGKLLNKPNKAGETVYSLDQQNPKSLLASVLRPRKLNAQRTEDALLGYDVYSNALADILTDPSLTLPITVGLFSKWGSGKSFMIEKLHEDMEAFARQFGEPRFTFSWILFWLIIVVSATICSGLTLTTHWRIGVALGVGLLIVCHVFLGVIWYGCTRREWNSAFFVGQWLFKHFLNMKLLLQVIFCIPPGAMARGDDTGKGACRIKFLFTERIRILSTELGGNAHKFLGMMLASLVNNLEREYGPFSTKMFYAFRTESKSEHSRWKWKKVCCIPYVFVLCVFILMMLGMLVILAVEKEYDEDDDDVLSSAATSTTPASTTTISTPKRTSSGVVNNYLTAGLDPERKKELLDIGLWFTVGMMVLIALAAIPACLKAVRHLFSSRERRLFRMLRNLDRTNRPEDMLKALKSEFDQLVQVVRCIDAFAPVHQQQTRLVIVLDGSEGSDTQKVLHVVDAVKSLFTSPNMPFISLIAVDPHMIIGALEEHTHTQLQTKSSGGGGGGGLGVVMNGGTVVASNAGAHHLFMNFPSTINGYDYLRTVIHLPVYLQNQTLLMKRALRNAMLANAAASNAFADEKALPDGTGGPVNSSNTPNNTFVAGRNSIVSGSTVLLNGGVVGARNSRPRLSAAGAAAQQQQSLAVPTKRFLSIAGGAPVAGVHNSTLAIGGSGTNSNTIRASNVDILSSMMVDAEKGQLVGTSTTTLSRRPSKLTAGSNAAAGAASGLPSFRQQSVMLRLTSDVEQRGGSQLFFGGGGGPQSPNLAAAAGGGGGRSLLADDYFSDLHPNTLRRLMNIIFLMGRLLKAFDLPFNWYRLSAWVHITEQWPYRISYVLLFYEYNEAGISDAMTLRELYEEVKRFIPNSSEDEPLLEIDRNVRKFDSYMRHQNPALTVGDMKVFLPLSINLDPFLRKLIKDRCSPRGGAGDESVLLRRQNVVGDAGRNNAPPPPPLLPTVMVEPPPSYSVGGLATPPTFASGNNIPRTSIAWAIPSSSAQQQQQPPAATPYSREAVQRRTQSAVNSRLAQNPSSARDALPMQQQPDLVPTSVVNRSAQRSNSISSHASTVVQSHRAQNNNSQVDAVTGGELVLVNGQLVEQGFVRLACDELEHMTVDDVCTRILSCWLNIRPDDTEQHANLLQRYSDTIRDENITGAVLLHCDLNDLRQVLAMRFGDWELLRHRIVLARAAKTEAAARHAVGPNTAAKTDEPAAAAAAANTRQYEDKHDGNVSDPSVIDIDIQSQQIKYAPPTPQPAPAKTLTVSAPMPRKPSVVPPSDELLTQTDANKDIMSSEESHFASVFRLPQFQTPVVPPTSPVAEAPDEQKQKNLLQVDSSGTNIIGSSRLSILSTNSARSAAGQPQRQRRGVSVNDPATTIPSVIFDEQQSPATTRRNDTFTNMVLTEGDILENAVMNATEDYYYEDDDDENNLLAPPLPTVTIKPKDKRLYEAVESDADAAAPEPTALPKSRRKKEVETDFHSNPSRGRVKDDDEDDDDNSDADAYKITGKDAEAINQLALEQLDMNFASNEDLGAAVRMVKEQQQQQQQLQQKNNIKLSHKAAGRRVSDTVLTKRPSSSMGLTTTAQRQPEVSSNLSIPKPSSRVRRKSSSKTTVIFDEKRNSAQQQQQALLLPSLLGKASRSRHTSIMEERSPAATSAASPPHSELSAKNSSSILNGEKSNNKESAAVRPSLSAIAAAAAAVAVAAAALPPTQSNPTARSMANLTRQTSATSSNSGLENNNNNRMVSGSQLTVRSKNDAALEMRAMLRDVGSYSKPPPPELQSNVDDINEYEEEAAKMQMLQQQKQSTTSGNKKQQDKEKAGEQKERNKESRWTSQAETFQDERKVRHDDVDTDDYDL